MFKGYRTYLADNPEGYWFKRKAYGYGWTPALWQGWALTGFYFVVIFGLLSMSSSGYLLIDPEQLTFPLVGITLLYIAIVWKTGQPLKWQWGIKEDSESTH